ncbi:MAG: hypothetical protein OIF56_08195 [Cohaesibacter sp.]|nr:hypothetical protein [Cohaesibacter sp.]
MVGACGLAVYAGALQGKIGGLARGRQIMGLQACKGGFAARLVGDGQGESIARLARAKARSTADKGRGLDMQPKSLTRRLLNQALRATTGRKAENRTARAIRFLD